MMDIKLTDLVLTKKRLGNLIQTKKGRTLTHREVKAFAKWGLTQGYHTVKDLPEYEDVENQIVKFSNAIGRDLCYLIGDDTAKLF